VKLIIDLILGGAGLALMIAGVESLIKTVKARAALAGVSALALGLLSTSADFESTAAGIANARKGLGTLAAGISVGSVIFLVTGALGIACLLFPFSVESPRYFLKAFLASAGAAALVLLDGRVGRFEGVALVALFGVLLAGAFREMKPTVTDGPASAGTVGVLKRTRLPFIAKVVGSLTAMAVGAELLSEGAQRVLVQGHFSQTFLGMVVVAVAISLEEGLIEVLPAYRGSPEIAVGNVLGTTTFLLTGSLGAVALAFPLHVAPQVVSFHLPAMLGAVSLAAWSLTRKVTGRREGVILIGYYALYVCLSWFVG